MNSPDSKFSEKYHRDKKLYEEWIYLEPTKRSLSCRKKKVYGEGINDANFMPYLTSGNKKIATHPVYQVWISMMARCYSPSYQKGKPTYKGCEVCDEWKTYSNFHKWMILQDWYGKQLDKDIIKKGNKVYSPDTCLFVTREINMLLTDHRSTRNGLKIGVSFNKRLGKYVAESSKGYGKSLHIGVFDSEDEAHKGYLKVKAAIVRSVADEQEEPLKSIMFSRSLALEENLC